MKNYNEVADDVLRRRDEYYAEKYNRRRSIQRSLVSVACFCLVAVAGIGVWKSGGLGNTPIGFVENSKQPSGQKDKDNNITTPENKGDLIIVNNIDDISGDRMNICLLCDDFIAMGKQEITKYYGTNIFPKVPSDLKEWGGTYGIYKRNSGTGEVYWDGNVTNYSNEDFSRSVNIEVKKDSLPLSDIGDFYNICNKSIVSGVEVGIGQNEAGVYFVEFIHNNTGFRMIAEGISQEELVSIITSLIS